MNDTVLDNSLLDHEVAVVVMSFFLLRDYQNNVDGRYFSLHKLSLYFRKTQGIKSVTEKREF
jgi:hypothetical protein